MTKWARAKAGGTYRCGLCGELIAAGSPVLVMAIDRVAMVRYRCDREKCGGPAPPDLPALPVLEERPAPLVILRHALLPLDWRPTVAQLREREPGEDD